MRLQRWEKWTDWPLTVAALGFLVAYAWPILQPSLDGSVTATLSALTVILWLAFAVDYIVRVWLAERRWSFIAHHVPDLAMLALPVLRPLRALRAVMALSRLNRHAAVSFRGRAVVYIAGALPLVVFVAAVAMLDAERGAPDANIQSFGDAVWWACTTMTTVGYGDRFPVTTEGRLIGVGLMLAGIALLGVVTAALASWFVERISDVEVAEAKTQAEVQDLVVEVRALREQLDERRET